MKKKLLIILLSVISITCLATGVFLFKFFNNKVEEVSVSENKETLKTASEIASEYKEAYYETDNKNEYTDEYIKNTWFKDKTDSEINSETVQLNPVLNEDVAIEDSFLLSNVSKSSPQISTLLNYITDFLKENKMEYSELKVDSYSVSSNNMFILNLYIDDTLYHFYTVTLDTTEKGDVQIYYVKE